MAREGLIWEMSGLFRPVPSTRSGNGAGRLPPVNGDELEHSSKMAVADTANGKVGVIGKSSVSIGTDLDCKDERGDRVCHPVTCSAMLWTEPC